MGQSSRLSIGKGRAEVSCGYGRQHDDRAGLPVNADRTGLVGDFPLKGNGWGSKSCARQHTESSDNCYLLELISHLYILI